MSFVPEELRSNRWMTGDTTGGGQILFVDPGDVLVVIYKDSIDSVEAARVEEALGTLGVKVVTLPNDPTVMVIRSARTP